MDQLRPDSKPTLHAALPICTALLLALLAWLLPVAAWPMAAMLPLGVTPYVARRSWLYAALLVALPCGALAVAGAGLIVCATLWLPSAVCAAFWMLTARRHWPLSSVMPGLCLLCALCNAALLRLALGTGDLFAALGALATGWLTSPGQLPALLWLARAGVLDISGYSLLDVAISSAELCKALEYQLSEMALTLAPALVAEAAVITGVFTALRCEKGQTLGLKKPMLERRFRMLHIPPTYRGSMTLLCLGGLLLSLAEDQFSRIAGDLMYGMFLSVYRLLGVAVLVYLLSRRRPTRSTLYGLLGAIGYLLLPTVMLLVGLFDQFLHFRMISILRQEE